MAERVSVLAIIPARSGSKSVVDKNIRPLAGKPMIAYSIEHALASKHITRTIVSTDSEKYAAIARQHGAETPFLRPSEFAQDQSTDLEVFVHALNWLNEQEHYSPDICVHLRPTHPVRDPQDIDNIIEILLSNPDIDSVRSVVLSPETPFKMWFRSRDGLLSSVIQTDVPEAHSLPRQQLPQTYLQNASIDAMRSRIITQMHSIAGKSIYGYVMERFFDIDSEEQFIQAEKYILGKLMHNG